MRRMGFISLFVWGPRHGHDWSTWLQKNLWWGLAGILAEVWKFNSFDWTSLLFHFESLKLICRDGEEVGAPACLGRSYLPSVILPQFTLCLYDPKKKFCLMWSRGLGPRFFNWGRKLLHIYINFTFGKKLFPDLPLRAFFQLFLTFDLLRISSSMRKLS